MKEKSECSESLSGGSNFVSRYFDKKERCIRSIIWFDHQQISKNSFTHFIFAKFASLIKISFFDTLPRRGFGKTYCVTKHILGKYIASYYCLLSMVDYGWPQKGGSGSIHMFIKIIIITRLTLNICKYVLPFNNSITFQKKKLFCACSLKQFCF